MSKMGRLMTGMNVMIGIFAMRIKDEMKEGGMDHELTILMTFVAFA